MPFRCEKMVIVGAGLIGGSLARALRSAGGAVGEIHAVGRNLDVLEKARQGGHIDRYGNDVATAVRGASMVIVCTPVGAMQGVFSAMRGELDENCVVSDVGSVKSSVIEYARSGLGGESWKFVPAHPISGTEHSGFAASFAELFQGRYTVVTPLNDNPPEAVTRVKDMWAATGSLILEMDPSTHDKVFAATSHLPHMLVYALMNTISGLPDPDKYFQVVAGGFLDYTRIASSDAVMWRDVCLSNKSPILDMIAVFRHRLDELESMISRGDADGLYESFARAKQVRDELVDRRSREKQTVRKK